VARSKPEIIDYKVSRRTSFTHNIMEVGLIPDIRVLSPYCYAEKRDELKKMMEEVDCGNVPLFIEHP